MTAKTAGSEVTRKDGDMISTPMIAAEIIYKGANTFAKAAGDAFSNDGTTNTLAAGDVYLGVAVETVDNSTGAAQATDVRTYIEGCFLMTFSDTITKANQGDDVYVNNASDDSVVTITTDTGNPQVTIGKIAQFVSSTTAYVKLTGALTKAANA